MQSCGRSRCRWRPRGARMTSCGREAARKTPACPVPTCPSQAPAGERQRGTGPWTNATGWRARRGEGHVQAGCQQNAPAGTNSRKARLEVVPSNNDLRRPAEHVLGAEPAAPRINGNLAQALGALLRRRIGRRRRFPHARDQSVDGRDYKEIHSRRHQYERHHRIDEIADGKRSAVDGEADGREIRLADYGSDQWSKQVFGESRDHRAEGRADDHTDRQVNYIASKDELLETAKHGTEPPKRKAANLRRECRVGQAEPCGVGQAPSPALLQLILL